MPTKEDVYRAFSETFLGRESELESLMSAWSSAVQGDPQLVLLVGESGNGKTRLAQRFYSKLSREHDPNGYWPDEFEAQANSLDVNPRMPEGGDLTIVPPFLWWGMRWEDDSARNRVEGSIGIEAYSHVLARHAWPIQYRRAKTKAMRKAVKSLAGSLVSGVAGTVVSTLVPIPMLCEALTAGYESLREFRAALVPRPHATARSDELEGLVRSTVTLIAEALKEPDCVGVLLLLDDAHWADKITLTFVHRLLRKAHGERLPIMVLATAWPSVLEDQYEDSEERGADGARLPPSVITTLKSLRRFADVRYREVQVGKLPEECRSLISSLFPGLAEDQLSLLLERADGNGRALLEYALLLESKPEWFDEEDPCRNLTERGLTSLREAPSDLKSLFSRRLSSMERGIRDAITIGSAQGSLVFVEDCVAEVVPKRQDNLSVERCLDRAEVPYTVIRRDSGASEYLHPFWLDLCHDRLSHLQNRATLERRVREWFDASIMEQRYRALPFQTRRLTIETAIRLTHEAEVRRLAKDVLYRDGLVREAEYEAEKRCAAPGRSAAKASDACIAAGERNLEADEAQHAEEWFERALSVKFRDKSVRAGANLRIARAYDRHSRLEDALRYADRSATHGNGDLGTAAMLLARQIERRREAQRLLQVINVLLEAPPEAVTSRYREVLVEYCEALLGIKEVYSGEAMPRGERSDGLVRARNDGNPHEWILRAYLGLIHDQRSDEQLKHELAAAIRKERKAWRVLHSQPSADACAKFLRAKRRATLLASLIVDASAGPSDVFRAISDFDLIAMLRFCESKLEADVIWSGVQKLGTILKEGGREPVRRALEILLAALNDDRDLRPDQQEFVAGLRDLIEDASVTTCEEEIAAAFASSLKLSGAD